MVLPLNQALVVAFLASAVASSPLNLHIGIPAQDSVKIGTGRHTFKQVRNPNYSFNGALSVKKTYLKFGKQIPDWLEHAVARFTATSPGLSWRDTGSAPATPIDALDDAYVTPVSIGTPGQILNLDLDTGSADLWVFSSETPTSEVKGQTKYDPSKSNTSKELTGEKWSISYGDGSSSSGDVYSDVVEIGGLRVSGQAVEVASQVSSSFTSTSAIDGLVGLAFSTLNTVSPVPQATFFDNVKPSLDAPLFTADLMYQAPGTYNFGFIDSTAYTGAITYTPVDTSQGFWEFTASGYAVGANGSFKTTAITGIADTGTTLLYLPAAVVKAYYAQINGSANNAFAGGYVFPCAVGTPPSFTFGVGAARIVIPGKYINFGAVTAGSASCFGGIQSSAGIGINIFGDVALKAAFVVFDGRNSTRLGWASKDS